MAAPAQFRQVKYTRQGADQQHAGGGRLGLPCGRPRACARTVALAAWVCCGLAVMFCYLPWRSTAQSICWGIICVGNVCSFLVFTWDKIRSKTAGAMRVPEIVLHAWEIAGILGAIIGIMFLRHKSSKVAFLKWTCLWLILNPLWALIAAGVHSNTI